MQKYANTSTTILPPVHLIVLTNAIPAINLSLAVQTDDVQVVKLICRNDCLDSLKQGFMF